MNGRALLAWVVLLFACGRKEPAPGTARASAEARASASAGSAAANSAGKAAAPPPSSRPPAPVPTSVKVELTGDAGLADVKLGELADIGPAGPVTASRAGVVMLTRSQKLLVARPPAGSTPARARFDALDVDAADLTPLGRGPSVAAGHGYWVSHGKLLRGKVGETGPVEVLASDARESCRTDAEETSKLVAVSYLGKPDDEGTCHARLWLSNGTTLDLTADGAGASSVSLAKLDDDTLLAVYIDGRSAMTPLHARLVELGGAKPRLEEDVVLWVGGPAHSFTEVSAFAAAGNGWAAVPLERDATHFGLATLDIGASPRMDTEASFFDYPNGLDLAPVAGAELCGQARLAFVRPTNRAPRSPAELVLADPQTGRTTKLADARGFAGVSMTAVPGGGTVAYVADGRTWVRGLGCL